MPEFGLTFVIRISRVHVDRLGYYLDRTMAGGSDGTGLVEPDGRYLGSLGDQLGVTRASVDRRTFHLLATGVHPDTGEVLAPHHHTVRNVGFDCVFAAPKSVSVLHGLGSGEVAAIVQRGHDESVEAAHRYLERNAANVRRRGVSGRVSVSTGALVSAAFVHRTSRANDPHLHTHVVVINLGVDLKGRYSALDARALYGEFAVASELYRAQLRAELSLALGVSWQRGRSGYGDIVGVSRRALIGFSKRSTEIAAGFEADVAPSVAQHQRAYFRTRPERDDRPSYRELREMWRSHAYGFGIGDVAFESRSAPGQTLGTAGAVNDFDRFDRPFLRRDLVREAARSSVDGAAVAELERRVDAALASPSIVTVQSDPHSMRRRDGSALPRADAPIGYVTRQAWDRSGRIVAKLEQARPLSIDLLVGRLEISTLDTGAWVVGRACDDPVGDLATVQRLISDAILNGKRVTVLAQSRIEAAHLQAMWDVDVTVPDGSWRHFADRVVIVRRPEMLPGVLVERLLDEQSTHSPVVFDLATRRRDRVVDRSWADTRAGIERFEIPDGARVAAATCVEQVISEAVRLADEARARSGASVIVTADSALSRAIGDVARSTGEVLRWGLEPDTTVVMIGSAAVAGSVGRAIDPARRIHVVVDRVGRSGRDRTRWLAERGIDRAFAPSNGRTQSSGRTIRSVDEPFVQARDRPSLSRSRGHDRSPIGLGR